MTTSLAEILSECVAIDPAVDLDVQLAKVPGRWVVYLLCDAEDQPIQLLCVKNLRASLKRRLGGNEFVGPTKKVNYRDIVRKVLYQRVDSGFESDWVYFQAAKRVFPGSYRGMVSIRPAWFVAVDPEALFPRLVKTQLDGSARLAKSKGELLGPVEDKHAAQRFVELVEDAFDLCRYYNILTQAPHGKACAYKQMHKCPAPCDGTVSMEQYRLTMQWAIETAMDPSNEIAQLTARMQAAAKELRFEQAGKIKQFVDQISQFGKGPFRHIALVEDFRYVAFQKGPWARTAEVFLISSEGILHFASLLDITRVEDGFLDVIQTSGWFNSKPVCTDEAVEEIAIVAKHLFSAAAKAEMFVRLDKLDLKQMKKVLKALSNQKDEETEDEGIVQETTAI